MPKPDISRKSRLLPRRNIAITFGVEKLEQCGYPKVKFFLKRYAKLFISIEYTNVHMTDSQTDTARRHMHSIVRQKNENFKIYTDHRDNSDRQLVKRINFHCHVNKNAARIAGRAGRGHM